MKRPMMLPPGWYPRERREVESVLRGWGAQSVRDALAALVPHAGWRYSGRLAFRALGRLRALRRIVVLGGHLGRDDPILVQRCCAFETPLGDLPLDETLLDRSSAAFDLRDDRQADNTIEVLLPLVRALFPDVSVLCLRLPPSTLAVRFGRFLADLPEAAETAVIASTDLTHYGPDYGFTPHGSGEAAERWVREVNDRSFLQAVLDRDDDAILRRALSDRSACSAGAAAAVSAFSVRRALAARLVGYASSLDLRTADSFVGYGAVVFTPEPQGEESTC